MRSHSSGGASIAATGTTASDAAVSRMSSTSAGVGIAGEVRVGTGRARRRRARRARTPRAASRDRRDRDPEGRHSFAHPLLDQHGRAGATARLGCGSSPCPRVAPGSQQRLGRCDRRSTASSMASRSPSDNVASARRTASASVSCMTSRSRSTSTVGSRSAWRSSHARRADFGPEQVDRAPVHLREQERPHRPACGSKRSGSLQVRTKTSCTTSSPNVRSPSTRRASPRQGPAWRRYNSFNAHFVAACDHDGQGRVVGRDPLPRPTSPRPRRHSCAHELFDAGGRDG